MIMVLFFSNDSSSNDKTLLNRLKSLEVKCHIGHFLLYLYKSLEIINSWLNNSNVNKMQLRLF